jgi:hypothetical protein
METGLINHLSLVTAETLEKQKTFIQLSQEIKILREQIIFWHNKSLNTQNDQSKILYIDKFLFYAAKQVEVSEQYVCLTKNKISANMFIVHSGYFIN